MHIKDKNTSSPDVPQKCGGGQIGRFRKKLFIFPLSHRLYEELFLPSRQNPNGCPISATFFVSHEWTDYAQVNRFNEGYSIFITHSLIS